MAVALAKRTWATPPVWLAWGDGGKATIASLRYVGRKMLAFSLVAMPRVLF
jgi:hypothetical protein